MSAFRIGLEFVAGLALFLYGVSRLAETLRDVAGDRARHWLARFTTNRFGGVATGTVATTVLDSSSVTIIMVIALVDAGMLTFLQSLGVILGANIGTTISSQIIAFDVGGYAPVALALGLGLHVAGRSERVRRAGLLVFSVGLIFFGLDTMGDAAEPLREYRPFLDLMERMRNPLLGALVGAGFTVLIQSSSATLGIVITLANQGLISLPAGVAIMLGAEIGTCADTLLATLGRSREAVRAGVFHLLFNLTTVAVGVLFAERLTAAAARLSAGAGVERQIANAHVLFNVAGVVAVVGFLPLVARALTRLIPDGPSRGDAPRPEPAPGA